MAELETAEVWQDHLEAWKRSGLTQIAYCANNQLIIKNASLGEHAHAGIFELSYFARSSPYNTWIKPSHPRL